MEKKPNWFGKTTLGLFFGAVLIQGGVWGYDRHLETEKKEKSVAAQSEKEAQPQKEEADRKFQIQKEEADRKFQKNLPAITSLFQACTAQVNRAKNLNPAWSVERCDTLAQHFVLERSAGEQKGVVKCLDQSLAVGVPAEQIDQVVDQCQAKAVYYAPKK